MKFRLITMLLLCSMAATMLGQKLNYPTERINGYLVYKYTTGKSIGLYRISKIFDVNIDDIKAWNPQLKDRDPQMDEVLYIPVAGAPREMAGENLDSVIARLPRYRLDVVMPFHVGNTPPNAQEERLIEFYRGVIMALYETPQKDSIFIDLYVHNSRTDTAAVAQMLRDSSLMGTNGIIGPFYTEQIELLSPWIRENRVPTILPVTNDPRYLTDNPYLMQYNSTPEQERKAMVEYLLSSDQKVHCVFIEDSIMDENSKAMREAISENMISYSSIHRSAVQNDSLTYALRTGAENIVFLPCGRFQLVKNLIPKIEALHPQHKMAVYGAFSWLNQQINVPFIYTSTFVTEQEADMTAYDEAWDKYFKMRHAVIYPRYDLLGYDVTRKLIGILTDKRYHGAQSDIDFEPYVDGGAMINSHIEVLRTE
ncbi:MAG: hypothetical protein II588_00700 [Paludibacteraceae bacterium]|nr:hypothetical protein [Paludibacteraceae bacterium]